MNKIMNLIGVKSRRAAEKKIDIDTKNKVLNLYAKLLDKENKSILRENSKDIKFAEKKGIKENLINRLRIDEVKLKNIKNSIIKISKLKDPVNVTLKKWSRPNGLNIKRITIPIGVIGVIFESRPNVTSDVASLCFKSGNAVILKGGSEAINTNRILAKLFRQALRKNKVDENYIQFVDSKDRKMVDTMLSKMKKYIDVIIPRGGKNLVKRVQEFSTVPIIGHLEGICHTFIDKDAELNMASKIIYNAKLKKLDDQNCKIYGDNIVRKYFKGKIYPAKEKDWSTEYLTAAVSVKVVKSNEEAIDHINKYGTMHTDSIVTKNIKTANKFLKNVKSSIAMHNTSTQFADGGEFGFGGEVGISTNTLPPRGPVGLEQLVSYKYEISSKGKIRK